jgi:hypothetical protein
MTYETPSPFVNPVFPLSRRGIPFRGEGPRLRVAVPVAMTELVKSLVSLQQIDTQRAKLLRDLQRIPREQQARFNEVEAIRVRLERGRDEVKRMRAEEKNLELELKARDERLEKLKIQANMARDSATLLATNHQIQTIKNESSKLEDRALGLVDRIGELEKDFDRLEAELAKAKEEYEGFAKACETELGNTKSALARLDATRTGAVSGVSGETMSLYQRLFQARDGVAVCAIDGDYCTGCSTAQLPNDIMKVKQGRELIQCKSCSRILYEAK